ncbi:hypothetical protein BC937DRAFT_88826 [Endogone sp. FLAS-F59071]|nr:hypothetical protein BC937DRAFT_88826 [Endogone sp. FLAS-F59071]|eukprot:RUS18383.1 hypothetical protein BC937DRAFT_88826 [Endogone sp. FLAS-F59071]
MTRVLRQIVLSLICANLIRAVPTTKIVQLSQDFVVDSNGVADCVDTPLENMVWTGDVAELVLSTSRILTGIVTDLSSTCLSSGASWIDPDSLGVDPQSLPLLKPSLSTAPKFGLIFYDHSCTLAEQLSTLQKLSSTRMSLNLVGILAYSNFTVPMTRDSIFGSSTIPTFSIPPTFAFHLLDTLDLLSSSNDALAPTRYVRVTVESTNYLQDGRAAQRSMTLHKKRGLESINLVARVAIGIASGGVILLFCVLLIYRKRLRVAYNKRQEAKMAAIAARHRWEQFRASLLTKEIVDKFPVVPYRQGLTANTECIFCLDEFREAYKYLDEGGRERTKIKALLILPCNHGFCRECEGIRGIEHWLTRTDRNCPLCATDSLAPRIVKRNPLKLNIAKPTTFVERRNTLRSSHCTNLEMHDITESKRLTRSEASSEEQSTISFTSHEDNNEVQEELILLADEENTSIRNAGGTWSVPPTPRTPPSIITRSSSLSEAHLRGGGAWSTPNSPTVPYSVKVFASTTANRDAGGDAWSTPVSPSTGEVANNSDLLHGPWGKVMNNGPWSAPLTSGSKEYDWKSKAEQDSIV